MKTTCRSTIVMALLASVYTQSAFAACLPMLPCVKLSSLQDLDFGTWSGTGQLQLEYDVCAYLQDDDETNYTITSKGNGPADALELTNGTDSLPVQVDYTHDIPTGWTTLATNTAETFTDPNLTNEDCIGGIGMSGRVRVRIAELDMQSVTSGTYSAFVRLTMNPD